jgi:hypothetical protein
MISVPPQARPGELIVYTVLLGNPRQAEIASVTTTTSLGALAEYVSANASQGTPSYDAGSHSVVLTVTGLAPGETVTLNIEVRLAATAPAGTQVAAITTANVAGFSCVQASTAVTITPAGIPVTGFGPGPVELAVLGGVGLGLLAGLLLLGRGLARWVARRR